MNARFRRNVIGLIFYGLFCLILLHGFLIGGLFLPLRIDSCSMSPFLHGPSAVLQCMECNAHYQIEANNDAVSDAMVRVVCPVCSFAEVVSLTAVLQPGDRVFVDKAAYSLRVPRRWETVLFRQSNDTQHAYNAQLTVKRVVGLPGETIKIQDGDVWVNDQRMIKPLEQQLRMRIPVRFGRWETQSLAQQETEYWLAFRPVKPLMHSKPFAEIESMARTESRTHASKQANATQMIDTPITNQLPENQWRRHFPENQHRVDDLMLEFDWESKRDDVLQVRAEMGSETYVISFDATENVIRVDANSDELYHKTVPRDFKDRKTHNIVVSLFDRRLLIAVDHAVVLIHDMQHDLSHGDRNESPFAVRLISAAMSRETALATTDDTMLSEFHDRVANLQVWRDVYYTSLPDDLAAKQQVLQPVQSSPNVTVPESCCFLLGDNSGFSVDSRIWEPQCVHYNQIIGPLFDTKQKSN